MNQAALVDDSLAGRAIHHHLPTVQPLITHPESHRSEPPRLREVFGHPRAVRIQGRGETFYQGFEKPLSGFGSGALQYGPQGDVNIEIFKRLPIHRLAVGKKALLEPNEREDLTDQDA
jgi:hypothetical protein